MKIEKSYRVPFSVHRVYSAWISSKTVIAPATRMDVNPVVGGHYRLFMEAPEFTAQNEGKFLEVDPQSHLKYTWEWNADGNVTEISVDFEAADDGTEVRIVHSGFTDEESRAMHATGWDSYIDGLTQFLKNR
ncbi:SRPBCC domain-containing protein [Hoeflea sp. TYP-13]|uniref:SRPBCC domain-containing protein n=1 Tax=Hoeflea sp. TYP-13 TaxID=3230023 RepID=UPI0034C640B1